MKDKISVIIPIYNAENKIENCVRSIINQSYKNIEIILVNDGSTDDSLNIINKIKDSRIKILNKNNGGVSSARNAGIEKAIGEYIVFVDADDTLSNDALVFLHKNMINKVDLVIGNSYVPQYNKIGNVVNQKIINKEIFQCKVFNKLYFDMNDSIGNTRTVWGKLYKTKIIRENNIHFDEKIKLFEDGIFNIEYTNFVRQISVINDVVYNYNIDFNSAVHKFYRDKYEQDVYKINLISQKKFNIGVYEKPFNLFVFELYVDYLKNKYEMDKDICNIKNMDLIYNKYITKLEIKYLSRNLKIIYIFNKLKLYKLIEFCIVGGRKYGKK